MPIQFVGCQSGNRVGSAGSSLNVPWNLAGGIGGPDPLPGDFVVISYSVGSTADRALSILTDDGTTQYDLIAELYQNDTFDSNLRTAYRFMPDPVPAGGFNLGPTGNNADGGSWTVHVWRGVDPSNPLDVAAVTAGGINGRVVDPGAITPVTAGAVIYVVGAGAGATGGGYTASYLSSFLTDNGVDTNDGFIGAGWLSWPGGTYDPAAFTGGGTSTTNDSWNAITVALRPAPAGVTYDKSASDAGIASDTGTATRARATSVSDQAIANDSAAAARQRAASTSDQVIASDSAAAARVRSASAVDGVLASDVAQASLARIGSASDVGVVSDSATADVTHVVESSASDQAIASDSATAARTRLTDASDGVRASDTASARLERSAGAQDAVIAADAATAQRLRTAAASDQALASDSATAEVEQPGVFQVSASDAALASDTAQASQGRSAATSDQALASDSGQARLDRVTSASDQGVVSDSAQARLDRSASASDTVLASDSATASVETAGAFDESASDHAVAADTALVALLRSVSAGDTALASDEATAVVVHADEEFPVAALVTLDGSEVGLRMTSSLVALGLDDSLTNL